MDIDNKKAARNASFVQFAYNMFAAGGLLPPPDPGIDSAGFDLVYYLNAFDFSDKKFYGYIAASKTSPGDLVMAIRGTEDISEWLLDFATLPVPFTPVPDAGFVALGFLSIFDSFEIVDKNGASMTLTGAVAQIAASSGIQSFTVIGHSLGAALSTLTAAALAMLNPGGVKDKLTSYTFASPRVGLLDFAASFNKAVGTSFRIWNTLDIVPEVPTFPFIHVSGLGDAIIQTEEQLNELTIKPSCEHALASYQWLLDPADFPLGNDCKNAVLTHALTALAGGVQSQGPTRLGAQALRRAARGRV